MSSGTKSVNKIKRIASVYARSVAKNTQPNWDLVKRYLPLVKSLTSKLLVGVPDSVDKENICTIGLLGLINATRSFNEESPCGFGTYATIRIKGALVDELRKLDWLPRNTRVQVKLFQRNITKLEQEFGRNLTEEEICKNLNLTVFELKQMKRYSKPLVYIPLDMLYEPTDEDKERHSLQDVLADLGQENSRELFERKEVVQVLKVYLKELPKITQQILALYYVEDLRMSEIAKVFQISESRVCQVHGKAIVKLRDKLVKFLKE